MNAKNLLPLSLAFSITLSTVAPVLAAPGDVNSVNDGQTVQSGTYFNTPGSRTTFTNSSNTGLWLHSGDLVRGLESDINKVPTGNGGTLYFRAPGQVVRLDGNIDVSAVKNGNLYTGNGGKVFVDSAYLFQNGNIFANGANGGLVQFNVGSLTVGPNAHIMTQGYGGDGGTIDVNATGVVDIQKGAVLDASGKVLGTFDTNIINIEGGLVNNEGLITANGVASADIKPDNGDAAVMAANPQLASNPVPAPITAGSGSHDTATMQNALFATPSGVDFRGGTIRLVSTGKTFDTTGVVNNSSLLTSTEKTTAVNRNSSLVRQFDGDVVNRGTLSANGALAKDGGTVIIASARNAQNNGTISANGSDRVDGVFDANGNGANGGNGGTISINALGNITNTGTIRALGGRGSRANTLSVSTGNGKDALSQPTAQGGTGGKGGVIAFSYGGTMTNNGSILANGGVGGLGASSNAFDSESNTSTNLNPVANATAIGGKGGTGGKGGLIVFSGNSNPTGTGQIQANGGQGGKGGTASADARAKTTTGSPDANANATGGAGGDGGAAGAVVTVNPASFSMTLSNKAGGSGATGNASTREVLTVNGTSTTTTGSTAGSGGSVTTGNNATLLATRKNEYIHSGENAILLTEATGGGTLQTGLSNRFNDAVFRTVDTPTGTGGNTFADAQFQGNLIVSSSTPLDLVNNFTNSNINPLFFNLNTLTEVNQGNLTNNTLWTPGVHVVGEGFHDIEFGLGGGHISWLNTGNITNNQIVMTRGLWSGGSTDIVSTTGNITNNNDFINIGPNKALLSGFNMSGPEYSSSHAGALTLKAGGDITNASTGKMETFLIFFDIHPPLNQNPPIDWPKFLNGAQIGSVVNLLAGHNLTNAGRIQADAMTYRNGANGAANPALTQGGIIIGRVGAGGTFSNTGTISADGSAFFSPNEADGPRFNTNTFPQTTSFDGTIDIK